MNGQSPFENNLKEFETSDRTITCNLRKWVEKCQIKKKAKLTKKNVIWHP